MKKKENPHARMNRIIARLSNVELHEILKKAHVHSRGNLSRWIREAALNYQPKKGGK